MKEFFKANRKMVYIVLGIAAWCLIAFIKNGISPATLNKPPAMDSINVIGNVKFDSLGLEKQKGIIKDKFDSYAPPNSINIDKLLKSQFAFPKETSLDYKNFRFFNSQNIVTEYEYESKNALGVKTSGSIRVWYKSDQLPNDSFTAYKFEIVSNQGEISTKEIIYK